LEGILEPQEQVATSSFAQLKQAGDSKRMAMGMGVTLVKQVALGTTGFAAMRQTMPALVWVVVTQNRLLMFERPDGRNSIGELVFNAPLAALKITDNSGLRGDLAIDDSASGDNLVRLNFGLRKGAAREIAASVAEL
jgi:hypothetical protein